MQPGRCNQRYRSSTSFSRARACEGTRLFLQKSPGRLPAVAIVVLVAAMVGPTPALGQPDAKAQAEAKLTEMARLLQKKAYREALVPLR